MMFQGNHMKNQASFSSKVKSKKLKIRLLQFCLALVGLIAIHTYMSALDGIVYDNCIAC